MVAGPDILIPKLDYLKELLARDGMEAELVIVPGDLPYLRLALPDAGGVEAELAYLPADTRSYSEFAINIQCLLEARSPQVICRAVCDVYNESSTGGFAYLNAEHSHICCRAVLPEAEAPVSEAVLRLFTRLYARNLARLKNLLEEEL